MTPKQIDHEFNVLYKWMLLVTAVNCLIGITMILGKM